MGMTREEKLYKKEILDILREDRCYTYSKLFNKLDLNITDDPGVIAYFEPNRGRIVINRFLDEKQISVIIRHEILHYFLEHERRLVDKLSKEKGIDGSDEISLRDIKNEIYSNKDFNIAGDFEISNVSYTEEDKDQIRKINLNGNILTGLVTEDSYPNWINLSLEDMYDELKKIREEAKKRAEQDKNDPNIIPGILFNPTTFIDTTGRKYGL